MALLVITERYFEVGDIHVFDHCSGKNLISPRNCEKHLIKPSLPLTVFPSFNAIKSVFNKQEMPFPTEQSYRLEVCSHVVTMPQNVIKPELSQYPV